LGRFHFYSSRVRILDIRLRSKDSFRNCEAFEHLSEVDKGLIFPNLKSLVWVRPIDGAYSLIFMHEHISHFKFRIPSDRSTGRMLSVLDEAAEHMPYLTNIEVEQRIPAPRINAWYARIVPKLRHLKVFKVTGHLEGDVFSKLAELPSLRYI
jgi:hypothetical protein